MRAFLDCVCEDVTWISGESGKGKYFLVWDRLKFSKGYKEAARVVLDDAALRAKEAKPGSVLAEIVAPYSFFLNVDAVAGKDKDYTLQDLPFCPTCGSRLLGHTSAHLVNPPRNMTPAQTIETYAPINERDNLLRLYKAFREFTDVKRKLKEEYERDGGKSPRSLEIKRTLPQMFA